MKTSIVAVIALAFGLAAVGCTPSPEKTCEKLQELADKEAASKTSGKPFNLDMKKCVDNMNEMKERDAQAYKCAAKTISKLSNLDTAFLAISVCDPNGKSKKKDKDKDDEVEQASKKKKKSDD